MEEGIWLTSNLRASAVEIWILIGGKKENEIVFALYLIIYGTVSSFS